MKVWIVCDNNVDGDILLLFKSLKTANEYRERYSLHLGENSTAAQDCWIFDEEGTEVRE